MTNELKRVYHSYVYMDVSFVYYANIDFNPIITAVMMIS